jgi:formylglycine-generating enzyme required for sulfatase activity
MRTALQLASLVAVSGGLLAFGGTRDPIAPAREVAPVDPDVTAEPDESAGPDESADPDESAEPDDESGATSDDDPDDTGPAGASPAKTELAEAPDAGKHHAKGGCPSTMVRAGNYCIDRYEAPNHRGARPFVMQSANDANAWCTEHHKRLCTEDEWIAACQGEEHRTYPYGNEHVDGRCNDDKPWEKVDEALLAKWPAPDAKEHAKALYQGTPSGAKRKCTSEYGARDMTGNVEEWVVRTREHANAWPYILIGCYWAGCYGGNKPTCHSTNNAHGPEFRFYETGFRCCKDVPPEKR